MPVFFCFTGSLIQAEETAEPPGPSEVSYGPELLSGRRMRAAFREVVAVPAQWTVSILADGEQVALGAIVGADGWILTKASQTLKGNQVQFADGRQFVYASIGYHQNLDLALLKVDVTGLPVVQWEESAPQQGSWMITVGPKLDPIGVGVLSVPRRKIPRSDVHGYLGVELAREAEPRIKRVFPNSGASEAGLLAGDVVLEINRHSIASGEQLVRTLRGYRPGDTLLLRVRRLEEEFAYSVTLMHPYGDFLSRMAFQNQMGGDLSFRRDDFEAAYQHDTVLAPKDCGGTVVNLNGRAWGLNIARAGRTESYTLPADLILPALEEMKSGRLPPPSSLTQQPGLIPTETVTVETEENP